MNWPRLGNSSKVLFSQLSRITQAHRCKQPLSVKIAEPLQLLSKISVYLYQWAKIFHFFFNARRDCCAFFSLFKLQLHNFGEVAFHLKCCECRQPKRWRTSGLCPVQSCDSVSRCSSPRTATCRAATQAVSRRRQSTNPRWRRRWSLCSDD